ncbi:MAG: hypothetical protein FE835_18640 [Gammaproteobacteria bacterium]|nr:hypothetical protein [Gammaproteobacteria bacterium]
MTVHFIAQRKGGVGKTLVSSMIAEYALRAGPTMVIDMDPKNGSISEFKELKATPVLMNDLVSYQGAGSLLALITESPSATSWVVDTAGESFDALLTYLSGNGIRDILTEAGHEMFIHIVVSGGASLAASGNSLGDVYEKIGPDSLVVWRNDFFGPVVDDALVMKISRDARGVVDLVLADNASVVDAVKTKYNSRHLLGDKCKKAMGLMPYNRIVRFYNGVIEQLDEISHAPQPKGPNK